MKPEEWRECTTARIILFYVKWKSCHHRGKRPANIMTCLSLGGNQSQATAADRQINSLTNYVKCGHVRTPSLSVLLCYNADLTQQRFCSHVVISGLCGCVQWHKKITLQQTNRIIENEYTWTDKCTLFSGCERLTFFTLPSVTGYLELQVHLRVHQLLSCLKYIFTFVLSCMWYSKWISAKKKKQHKVHLFDRRLPTHIWSHPNMWYRRGTSIQTEVMGSVFWVNATISTPKMKSCGGIQRERGLL